MDNRTSEPFPFKRVETLTNEKMKWSPSLCTRVTFVFAFFKYTSYESLFYNSSTSTTYKYLFHLLPKIEHSSLEKKLDCCLPKLMETRLIIRWDRMIFDFCSKLYDWTTELFARFHWTSSRAFPKICRRKDFFFTYRRMSKMSSEQVRPTKKIIIHRDQVPPLPRNWRISCRRTEPVTFRREKRHVRTISFVSCDVLVSHG